VCATRCAAEAESLSGGDRPAARATNAWAALVGRLETADQSVGDQLRAAQPGPQRIWDGQEMIESHDL
jgi:hypothetical protein